VKLWAQATGEAPDWGRRNAANVLYYARAWAQAYPWLAWVLPGACVFACVRHGRKGFLLLGQFGVPMLLHSVVFSWKAQRYVSYLLPLAALLLAPFVVWACTEVIGALREMWGRWRRAHVLLRGLAVALVLELAVVVAVLAAMPSVQIALALRRDPHEPNWRAAFAHVAAAARPGDALLTSSHLSATYYLPRQGVRLSGETPSGEPSAAADGSQARRELIVVHDEWHRSVAALQRVMARHQRGWLVTAPNRLYDPDIVAPAVRRHVESSLQREPVDAMPAILVFRWGESAAAPAAAPR
jgi:hypothetical protein